MKGLLWCLPDWCPWGRGLGTGSGVAGGSFPVENVREKGKVWGGLGGGVGTGKGTSKSMRKLCRNYGPPFGKLPFSFSPRAKHRE